MATESQIDLWRRDIRSNLNKAGAAAKDKALDAQAEVGTDGEISFSDRMCLALASATVASNLIIGERLGQIVQALYSDDETLEKAMERTRTGEQVIQRIVDAINNGELELSDEAMITVTMAEDWLNPEGLVGFATPEAVEQGRDPHSALKPETVEEPEQL